MSPWPCSCTVSYHYCTPFLLACLFSAVLFCILYSTYLLSSRVLNLYSHPLPLSFFFNFGHIETINKRGQRVQSAKGLRCLFNNNLKYLLYLRGSGTQFQSPYRQQTCRYLYRPTVPGLDRTLITITSVGPLLSYIEFAPSFERHPPTPRLDAL